MGRSSLREDSAAARASGPGLRQAQTVHRTVCVRAQCIGPRAHGKTRYAGCARCAQTLAVSRSWMRAARAALKTARRRACRRVGPRQAKNSPQDCSSSGLWLGASRSRHSPRPHSPLQPPGLVFGPKPTVVDERQAVHGAGAMWGAEQRSLEGGRAERASWTDSPQLFERSSRQRTQRVLRCPLKASSAGKSARRADRHT